MSIEAAMNECINIRDKFELKAVEVRFEKEFKVPSLWPWETSKTFESFLDNFEITGAHLPFAYLNPICPNPYIKDSSQLLIKKSISKASDLGMTYVVMHARGQINGMAYRDQLPHWLDCFKELEQYAKKKSVILTIENADSLADLYDLTNIIKKIDSKWLKLTLDIGHAHLRIVPHLSYYPVKELALRGLDLFLPFTINNGMPYEKYGSISNFLNTEMELISNIHIHDYDGKNDHLLLGDGKIGFGFLKGVVDTYTGIYIFETKLSNQAEFRKNYDFLQKLLC